jgi:hypothetical protein
VLPVSINEAVGGVSTPFAGTFTAADAEAAITVELRARPRALATTIALFERVLPSIRFTGFSLLFDYGMVRLGVKCCRMPDFRFEVERVLAG